MAKTNRGHGDKIIRSFPGMYTKCINYLRLLYTRAPFQYKEYFSKYRIPTIKIKWSWDFLLFIMEILILIRHHIYFQIALKGLYWYKDAILPAYKNGATKMTAYYHHNWSEFRIMVRPITVPYISRVHRDHFVYAPSQWEMTLPCNVISHWLGAYTKWSLSTCNIIARGALMSL